ncbi:pilus assembly protein [Francisella adeliensis]|uniref:pilus assembly protein n=1 Tax=Francisella adeliensis TaxID=2007306 RepID=UPI0013AEC94C|nr:pilus assembly protein [Francisella adeliensis]MBK2084721.1 pilus assembly protein [Francisella adeliensis]MBK2097336.1 pilus assembly protein [Francisella adeliensis]
MSLKNIKSQKGFGIVESMLSAMILLFVLSSGFILLNSVLVSIALDNKKDEISSTLDERVSIYRLTGVFDDKPTKNGIEFKKTVIIEQENESIPEEKSEEKSVNRFKALSVADIKKMAEKADKKAQKAEDNDVNIVYKIVNIAAFDDTMGVADRIKIVEREVVKNESDEV